MCEAIEMASGSIKKQEIISESIRTFSNSSVVLDILSEQLEPNNIGVKKARIWLAEMLEVFEDEVIGSENLWGDLAEGIYQMVLEPNEVKNSISISTFNTLLKLDCSSKNNTAFTILKEELDKMTGLEMKWFIRYWLRTPRNGISSSNVYKALKSHFGTNYNVKYDNYHSPSAIYTSLVNNTTLKEKSGVGVFIKPMLAKKYDGKLPYNYILDTKFDGNRYQMHISNTDVIIFNRTGKIVTEQFRDVATLQDISLCKDMILDCEIYPINVDGSPAEHKRLATRVHSKNKIQAMIDCPVKMVAFDILYVDGKSWIEEPYRNRLAKLHATIDNKYITEYFQSKDLTQSYNLAINRGFEGIMIKDLDAPYAIGKRNKCLLKHKPPMINLDVIIDSAKYGEGRRSSVFGTFGISVKSPDGYVNIGSVGTGFSDDDLTRLTTDLKKIVDKYDKDIFYVLPRVVIEVTCDLISQDAEGNFGLRFPRMIRIRDDKYPADINTLEDIRSNI
tara:strand:- start:172 stop:1680 length:1509 start_codon:yes stop_codon:yes gene_type:complete